MERLRLGGPVAAVVLGLGLGLAGCSQTGVVTGAAPKQLPLPPQIAVAFNQRADGRYRSPISGQWRSGDDLEAMLLHTIEGAQSEVLVAVQELSLPRVAQALAARQRAGVTVKVVLENTYSQPWSQQHEAELSPHLRQRRRQLAQLADRDRNGALSRRELEQGDAVLILQRAGVPMLDDTADGSAGSGLMHEKVLVVDRQVVVTGSANFTPSCIHGDADDPRSRGNTNHLLRIDSPALAVLFVAEFGRMWGDGPGGAPDSRFGIAKQQGGVQTVQVGPSRIQVLFAPHRRQDPDNGLQLIARELRRARRRVDMALFVFSAQELSNQLAALRHRGVALRLMADPGFASRPFSEVLDLLGVSLADRRCRLEAGNRPLAAGLEGVGTPQLAGGDKLHHKVAVIDNRTVITGSFNWSPSAAHQNDEVLLVIHSPLLAAHFTREIDRLWQGAELGITDRLARKLQRGRELCGRGVMRG